MLLFLNYYDGSWINHSECNLVVWTVTKKIKNKYTFFLVTRFRPSGHFHDPMFQWSILNTDVFYFVSLCIYLDLISFLEYKNMIDIIFVALVWYIFWYPPKNSYLGKHYFFVIQLNMWWLTYVLIIHTSKHNNCHNNVGMHFSIWYEQDQLWNE